MKQPQPITLEHGIRALQHEARVYATLPAVEWDHGVQEGIERAIRVLKNLDVANQRHGEDPHT